MTTFCSFPSSCLKNKAEFNTNNTHTQCDYFYSANATRNISDYSTDKHLSSSSFHKDTAYQNEHSSLNTPRNFTSADRSYNSLIKSYYSPERNQQNYRSPERSFYSSQHLSFDNTEHKRTSGTANQVVYDSSLPQRPTSCLPSSSAVVGASGTSVNRMSCLLSASGDQQQTTTTSLSLSSSPDFCDEHFNKYSRIFNLLRFLRYPRIEPNL